MLLPVVHHTLALCVSVSLIRAVLLSLSSLLLRLLLLQAAADPAAVSLVDEVLRGLAGAGAPL